MRCLAVLGVLAMALAVAGAQKTGFPCEAGRCEPCNQCVNGYCQVRDVEQSCGHPCQRCREGRCAWEPELFINVLLRQKCGPFPCESAQCGACEVCVPEEGCVRDWSRTECRDPVEACVRGRCPRCFDCLASPAVPGVCLQNFTRVGCPSAPQDGAPTERCGAALCSDCHVCIDRNCVPDFLQPRCQALLRLDKPRPGLCDGIPCPRCFVCVSGRCTRDTHCDLERGRTKVTAVSRVACGGSLCPPCHGCAADGRCRRIVNCDPTKGVQKLVNKLDTRLVKPVINFPNLPLSKVVKSGLEERIAPLRKLVSENGKAVAGGSGGGVNLGRSCRSRPCPACEFCEPLSRRCVVDRDSFLCRLGEVAGNGTRGRLCGGRRTCGLCERCEGGRCVRTVGQPGCQGEGGLLGLGCEGESESPCPLCTRCVLGQCVADLLSSECRAQGALSLPRCVGGPPCPACFRCDGPSGACVPDFAAAACPAPPDRCFKGNCPLCHDCVLVQGEGFCVRNESRQSGCSSTPFPCRAGRCPFCYACEFSRCVWESERCGPWPYPCVETGELSGCPPCHSCAFGYCLPHNILHNGTLTSHNGVPCPSRR